MAAHSLELRERLDELDRREERNGLPGDYSDFGHDAIAALEASERDAARYRHMRNNATFRSRNGPGLYWYLPRFLMGGEAEQLDAAIDAALRGDPNGP